MLSAQRAEDPLLLGLERRKPPGPSVDTELPAGGPLVGAVPSRLTWNGGRGAPLGAAAVGSSTGGLGRGLTWS